MDISSLFIIALFLIASSRSAGGATRSLQFTRSIYKSSIEEHFPFKSEPISQLVRVEPTIRASIADHRDGDLAAIRYSILSGDDDGHFRMDPTTGEILLVKQVDRESLPAGGFSLVIQASSADTEPAVARLMVEVGDLNDNPPIFKPDRHVISIVENLPVDFNVLKLSASDPDQGENGTFSYSLIDATGAFQIDPLTGWLSVFNSTALDRERTPQLIVWVVALEDRPNLLTKNQSSARVDIQLMDANDNSPVFHPSNFYQFTVESTAETGTVIGQVEAVDEDQDENGKVSYTIQHPPEAEKKEKVPFSIHPETGHVIVVDTPLIKTSYTLLIEAGDEPFNPSERRVSLAVVQIMVTSPLKAAEEPRLRFVNTPYEFWIGLSGSVGSVVGQVTALAADQTEDSAAAIRYTLKHNLRQTAPPLSVDPRSGVIRLAGELKDPVTYSLNVTASDGKQETVTAGLTVHVLEESRGRSLSTPALTAGSPAPGVGQETIRGGVSTPQLQQFRFNVTENSPAQPVGHINYPDRKLVEFTPLEPSAPGWQFLKLARNGTIYTRQPLDFERNANVSLFVTVRDQGRGALLDTVQVVVNVLDVNDNPPVFSRQVYRGRVKEDAAAGTIVRFDRPVKAVDADGPGKGTTRYSLSGANNRLFRMDPTSGEVSLVRTRSLDRERIQSFRLTVTASDGLLSSSAELNIEVEDVNDNPPEIAGFVPAMTVVALERSPDRQDLQNEGRIVVCSDGSCSLPINLDDGTPPLLPAGRSLSAYNRFRSSLFRILDDWIEEAERSIDHQVPPDENEILERAFQEILHNSSIFIQVPEDFPVNSSIGSFSAMDKDATAKLRFSLDQGGQDLFQLLPSGSLLMKRTLETDHIYPLQVEVTDGQGLKTKRNVSVQVMDVNNHRPVFDQAFYELLLPEGDYNRTPFVTIEATDHDLDENAMLTYSLTNGSHPFEIHPQSGMLLVNGLVDREKEEFYRFTVRVVDKGSPPLKNQADVVVYVSDVNDNFPQFERSSWAVTLQDGTPAGAPVARVKASDADSDVRTNANVTYRLDSHQDLFGIDPVSGTVFTLAEVQLDRGREYNVLVVAEDGGSPSLSAVGLVRVTVEEAPCRGDSAPRREQSITLEENVSTPLALVNLTESERGASIKLSLVRIEPISPVAQSLFNLDWKEPVLWLNGTLDRERGSSYTVHLMIQRRSNEESNVTCPTGEELVVNFHVTDVNDNSPVFDKGESMVVVVPFDASIGQEVVLLSATDADEGLNSVIKYSMAPYPTNRSGKKEFAIDPSTGLVSVASGLDRLNGRIQGYQVKATDRNGAGLTSTFLLSIHVLDHSHQVALVLATNHQELVTQSDNISLLVSDVSGMEVWVRSVEPHIDGDTIDGSMSDIVMYARNHSGSRLITSDDFSRVLHLRRDELDDRLSRYQLREIRGQIPSRFPSNPTVRTDVGMEALEVTLVAMGAAILLGTIVAVVCIVLSRLKFKKRTRLLAATPVSVGRLDYHLQPFRPALGPPGGSKNNEGGSSSAGGGSEMYAEVPNDLSQMYVTPLPGRSVMSDISSCPTCPICQRRRKKRCRCSCGKPLSRQPSSQHARLVRSFSDSLHRRPSKCCVHAESSTESPAVHLQSKQVRLSIPQRSMSVVIDPPVVHFKEDRQSHQHHQRRRHLSHPDGALVMAVPQQRGHQQHRHHHAHSAFHNSPETFEDSLESPTAARSGRKQPSSSKR